jgi:G3E family GTPase
MTTKVIIVSGFLGAGKTTMIQKMLEENSFSSPPVLIENDYGSIGIDSLLFQEAGIVVKEMTAGCICCSASGNFLQALALTIEEYHPEVLIIEPSGVGKLSDVVNLVKNPQVQEYLEISGVLTVVDAQRFALYEESVSDYLWDQIAHAGLVAVNKIEHVPPVELERIQKKILQKNSFAEVIFHIKNDSVHDIMSLICRQETIFEGETCQCCNKDGRMHYHSHPHTHEKFLENWSEQLDGKITVERVLEHFHTLEQGAYGTVYRAKGIVNSEGKSWLVDYVPQKSNVTELPFSAEERILVIGTSLNKKELEKLFQ